MRKEVRDIVVLAFCLVFASLICGCAKQQVSSEKQTRLVSSDLKRTIALRDKQIASLKDEIKNCEEQKAVIQNRTDDIDQELGDEFMKMFDENVRLQEENEALKKQVEELKNK